MAGKIATRNEYGEALVELAEKYPELVVLDADLSGSTMTKFLAAAHPDRFFDCGIAECDMAGIAAGLAADGLKPFINSFAMLDVYKRQGQDHAEADLPLGILTAYLPAVGLDYALGYGQAQAVAAVPAPGLVRPVKAFEDVPALLPAHLGGRV